MDEPDSSPPPPPGDLQVIARTAQILRLFQSGRDTIRLTDVVAETGLGKSTASRYLTSLAHNDLLRRDEQTLGYSPGPLLAFLGTVSLRGRSVVEAAAPVMRQLTEDLRETTVLSVWGGVGAVVAHVVEEQTRMVHVRVGVSRVLSADTAQTRIFLADLDDPEQTKRVAPSGTADIATLERALDQVRRDGYSLNETPGAGVTALAVPVRGDDGRVLATLAVLGITSRIESESENRILPPLLSAAGRISDGVNHGQERQRP